MPSTTLRRRPQVLDARVGARADEHAIERDVLDRRQRPQVHVVQRLLDRAAIVFGPARDGSGTRPETGDDHARVGAPRHVRLELAGIDARRTCRRSRLDRCCSSRQASSARSQSAPCGAWGRPSRYCEGRVVGRDHAGPRAAFDAHVAHRHAAFHRQAADGAAGVLDDVSDRAADADAADDAQDDVLGGDAQRQLAVDAHLHRFRLALRHGLGGQHVLDLAGADAEGQRAERAMRAGVTVAAHDGHARLGQAQLGPDDVHDALQRAEAILEADAELLAVALERVELLLGDGVGHRLVERPRGRVVVHRGDGQVWPAHRAAGQAQAVERLGRRHLVDEVQIDVQQRRLARRLRGRRGRPRSSRTACANPWAHEHEVGVRRARPATEPPIRTSSAILHGAAALNRRAVLRLLGLGAAAALGARLPACAPRPERAGPTSPRPLRTPAVTPTLASPEHSYRDRRRP